MNDGEVRLTSEVRLHELGMGGVAAHQLFDETLVALGNQHSSSTRAMIPIGCKVNNHLVQQKVITLIRSYCLQ